MIAYRGRRFTSTKILQIYSPIMPKAMRMRLPRNHIDSISDDQPDIALPPKWEINTHTATAISSISKASPTVKMMRTGFAVNEVMPSMPVEISFRKGYLVSPAIRILRSYETDVERNPM